MEIQASSTIGTSTIEVVTIVNIVRGQVRMRSLDPFFVGLKSYIKVL